MYRHPNISYAGTTSITNQSMFVRPLRAVASPQAVAVVFTQWQQPRCPWWTGQSDQQQTCFPTNNKKHSTFSWNEWRRPGVLPTSVPQKGFHPFAGRMDHSEKGPPPKKRKSTESKASGEQVQHCSKHSSPRESREHSSEWLKNVIGVPLSPGKFPLSTENTGSKAELKRHWEDLSVPHGCAAGSLHKQTFDFTVMSYNILSQELLLSNAYLYKHCNPHVLEWGHRFPNIIKELELHNTDIMCLQEVQEDHYHRQIKPRLESQGYHCEFKRRTGRKPDGCAVAFKRSCFSLLSCHHVEYFRKGIPLLDRDNVGLILLLQPVECSGSACNLCVANTHLLYNPRRGDIKLAQLAMLFAEISRVTKLSDGSSYPVLLCGDFNSVPWSPLYSFINKSRLEYFGMPMGKVSGQEEGSRGQRILEVPIWPPSLGISQQCQYEFQPKEAKVKEMERETSLKLLKNACIEHGLKLTSAYSHILKDSKQPEITTFHSRSAITVDYIFYSPIQNKSVQTDCSVPTEQGLQLLSRLALVSEAQLVEVKGLPNQHNSSDHLPLIARFRLHS